MAIDVAVEEVASNLEEIAQATRMINTKSVGYFIGGLVIGVGVGLYFGYKWNKEKIKAEAFEESEKAVALIREHYRSKDIVGPEKPPLEAVIEERGYDRPLPPPVPGVVEPEALASRRAEEEVRPWDYEEELKHRVENPDEPYVLHQEEYFAKETGYRQVVYTYYMQDDVLVGEDETHPLPHADIIVGRNNLQFGRGTDDPDVVYVRNNEHQLEMEICRVNKSFEEEILGHQIDALDEPDERDEDS